jgi:hypothetical protein
MTTSISDNATFRNACKFANLANFKVDPAINQIFEHVSIPFGEEYAALIRKQYPELAARAADFAVNDLIGGSIDRVETNGAALSPTTLRYVKVAGDLLAMGVDAAESIVEIGAGYGGQCLILDVLRPGSKPLYVIYDLPEAGELQKKYTEAHGIDYVEWLSAEDTPLDRCDFCLSNYAFSECTRAQQEWYLDNVILRSTHGYMVLNFISEHFGLASYSVQELLNRIPNSWAEADKPWTSYSTVILRW